MNRSTAGGEEAQVARSVDATLTRHGPAHRHERGACIADLGRSLPSAGSASRSVRVKMRIHVT